MPRFCFFGDPGPFVAYAPRRSSVLVRPVGCLGLPLLVEVRRVSSVSFLPWCRSGCGSRLSFVACLRSLACVSFCGLACSCRSACLVWRWFGRWFVCRCRGGV